MELRSFRHKVSGKRFRLVIFGDSHVGTIHTAEDRLKEDVARIVADKDCRVLHIGDMIDAVNISDRKRFDPAVICPQYELKDLTKLSQVQAHHFSKLIEPMADKLDGFFVGNHEENNRKIYHHDICIDIMNHLKLPPAANLREGVAFLRYTIESEEGYPPLTFIVCGGHGSWSAATPEAAIAKLKKQRVSFECDLLIAGHTHKRATGEEPFFTTIWNGRNGKIKEKMTGYLSTGSYLKTYIDGIVGYGEMRRYPPIDMGSVYADWDLTTGKFSLGYL